MNWGIPPHPKANYKRYADKDPGEYKKEEYLETATNLWPPLNILRSFIYNLHATSSLRGRVIHFRVHENTRKGRQKNPNDQ